MISKTERDATTIMESKFKFIERNVLTVQYTRALDSYGGDPKFESR